MGADAALDALGDPTRRRIVEVLHDGPSAVGDRADRLPVGRPAVSKHLKVLEGAGLITHRSHGTRNLYSLAPEGLSHLQVWPTQQWDNALMAFAEHVDKTTSKLRSLKHEPSQHPSAGARRLGPTLHRYECYRATETDRDDADEQWFVLAHTAAEGRAGAVFADPAFPAHLGSCAPC